MSACKFIAVRLFHVADIHNNYHSDVFQVGIDKIKLYSCQVTFSINAHFAYYFSSGKCQQIQVHYQTTVALSHLH